VLIVVDDPRVREALAECVASAGFEVATAGDMNQGLEHIRARLPVAVLLGMSWRRPEGYSFLAAMRRDRRAANIPVISVGGQHDAPREAPQHHVLEDPFDLDAIAKVLHRISARDSESTAGQPAGLLLAGAAKPASG
jgi:two-component system chemotaxis response regulator CheY